jgi:hypothetical protein
MSYTISAGSLFTKQTLKLKDWGVIFTEAVIISTNKKFRFEQIDLVLLSATKVLSFQVGREVFSIQTRAGNKKHALVIQKLLAGINGQPAAK